MISLIFTTTVTIALALVVIVVKVYVPFLMQPVLVNTFYVNPKKKGSSMACLCQAIKTAFKTFHYLFVFSGNVFKIK